jgi:peroxiredoxin
MVDRVNPAAAAVGATAPGGTMPTTVAGRVRLPALPLLLALLPLLALACAPDTASFRPLAAGDPAPAFAVPELGGDTLSLADLRGQPVLLNIWATWCPPCREEMPGLQALHESHGGLGLRVIGVSTDARGAEDAIRSFVDDHGITFTILHDPGETVPRRYRTAGVPETFLIDRDGTIVHRWIGMFDPVAPDALERMDAVVGG